MYQMSEFTAPIRSVLSDFSVRAEVGLSDAEVQIRQKKYGKNTSYLRVKNHPIVIFFRQFGTPLIIVLMIVSVISMFVGEIVNGSIILVMLLFNAIVGAIQEIKAEKSLEKLAALVSYDARVLRNGKLVTIAQEELVPGDIVWLKTGDVIPADIRLIEAVNMSLNESTLTGESLPVYKQVVEHGEKGTTPQEVSGSVFMGTALVGGHGRGVVTVTGRETFLGKTVGSRAIGEGITRFERDLKSFSDNLLRFVLIFSGITGIINVALGRDVITSLLLGITLALGITPEILPIVVTIAMSSGAFALAKKKVIVRRLSSLEDLGNVDILCTDKTGTLTTGRIKMSGAYGADGKESDEVLSLAYLCSAAFPTVSEVMTKNPLDEAIGRSLAAAKRKKLELAKMIDVSDFDFVTKRILTLVSYGEKRLLLRKGASEFVLKHSSHVKLGEKVVALTNEMCEQISGEIAAYEDKGFRVISLASEVVEEKVTHVGESSHMTFLGFLVFQDPPRFGIAKNIEELSQLKVSLKILTGDSREVTKEVAQTVGLKVSDSMLIEGKELDKLSEDDFARAAREHTFFVRVTPFQKERIIEVLRKYGHTVGYMGDGINDVGALRAADVGISVENATSVTKDVSDILLLEKDLSALGEAVIQGRKTFSNTIKFVTNTMSSSFGNALTTAAASLFLPFIPLLPAQLLLIDSLSDIQHLSFATDNVDAEMYQSPRNWDKRFINKFILVFGTLSTVFDFFHMSVFSSVATSPELFRTLWFIESVTTEMLATFSVRTAKAFFRSKPSRALILTTIATIALAVIIPMTHIGDTFFGFVHLQLWHYALIIVVVALYLVALEVTKKIFYQKIQAER